MKKLSIIVIIMLLAGCNAKNYDLAPPKKEYTESRSKNTKNNKENTLPKKEPKPKRERYEEPKPKKKEFSQCPVNVGDVLIWMDC